MFTILRHYLTPNHGILIFTSGQIEKQPRACELFEGLYTMTASLAEEKARRLLRNPPTNLSLPSYASSQLLPPAYTSGRSF